LPELIRQITDDFFPTLARWQDRRALWLAGGLGALGLEIFSVVYFQGIMHLNPCEYCVKVRLAMWMIFLGALFAAVRPRTLFFKLVGYVSTLAAAGWGLYLSAVLEDINLKTLHDPHWFAPCSFGRIKWPFGLRPDEWFPGHFMATGICGENSKWSFLGFSMTQWLVLVYVVMIAGLVMMLAADVYARIKASRAGKAA
jgi:disulfide bond formation protein DsbB